MKVDLIAMYRFLPHDIAIEFTEFSLGFWVQGPKPTRMQGDCGATLLSAPLPHAAGVP